MKHKKIVIKYALYNPETSKYIYKQYPKLPPPTFFGPGCTGVGAVCITPEYLEHFNSLQEIKEHWFFPWIKKPQIYKIIGQMVTTYKSKGQQISKGSFKNQKNVQEVTEFKEISRKRIYLENSIRFIEEL